MCTIVRVANVKIRYHSTRLGLPLGTSSRNKPSIGGVYATLDAVGVKKIMVQQGQLFENYTNGRVTAGGWCLSFSTHQVFVAEEVGLHR